MLAQRHAQRIGMKRNRDGGTKIRAGVNVLLAIVNGIFLGLDGHWLNMVAMVVAVAVAALIWWRFPIWKTA